MSSLQDRIRSALKEIRLPKLDRNLFEAGLVENIDITDGKARILLHLKPAYASKSQLTQWVKEAVLKIEGISAVEIEYTQSGPSQKQQRVVPPEARTARRLELPQIKEIVAIFSGKGGVGKSTISVNLAAALAKAGSRVGLFDGDVHGPNIPNLLGLTEKPVMARGKIQPIEKYNLKTISLGLLVEPDEALIWRGPMITKAINEMLGGVDWGELDYMIIDLPPGTGDAQLGLAQDIEISGSIAITTPQEVSLADVRRGIATFKKLEIPIWGMIENMSYFACSHCGKETDIFGTGGGEREAKRQGLPLLGKIPLDPCLRESGDRGIPAVLENPSSPAVKEIVRIAEVLLARQHQTV
ncbi:Mrp/NBP35 family ATP-binding protein [Candidatus Acetothermia bacterium]|nr:Mrp/NBP35 family ATP-binding protein [Candidatus Acetothermia bacterium]MBI3644026.1 Mrp/NBP35 family ATP-binding protein [Candidatus Acetothermia bacterium]